MKTKIPHLNPLTRRGLSLASVIASVVASLPRVYPEYLSKEGSWRGLLLLLCLAGGAASAQNVGISPNGSTPHASAGLDVDFTDKGLLIPRMTGDEKYAIPSPATGLLIFQTPDTAGFWYYNGAKWIPLLSSTSSTSGSTGGWGLSGNSSTTASNFLGTTDNVSLRIRTNDTTRVIVDSLGRVGIGTTNPAYRLHVVGSATQVAAVRADCNGTGLASGYGVFSTLDGANTNNYGVYSMANGGTTGNYIFRGSTTGGATNNYGIYLSGEDKNYFSGKVGIGTGTPAEKLTVIAPTNGIIARFQGGNAAGIYPAAAGGLYISENFSSGLAEEDIWNTYDPATYPGTGIRFLQRLTSSTYRDLMFLSNTGNVGIGTTNPTSMLNIKGSLPYIQFDDTDGGDSWRLGSGNGRLVFYDLNDATEYMSISSTGNVGIGTPSPAYKLTVNGQPAANGYTAFTNYSDARLKKNVTNIGSSLDKIMQLRPVQFNYNEEYLNLYEDSTALTRIQKGFIAQEVKKVFPEMVSSITVKGKEYYDLNLSNLQVYMVKAMQEQQGIIDSLQETVSSLQQVVGNLKAENELRMKSAESEIMELKTAVNLLLLQSGEEVKK